MSTYKDFEGKTLDDAISMACDYFGVAREKLEIDIINDAKSGIFGLVGAKKACIRAARVRLGQETSSLLADETAGDATSAAAANAPSAPAGKKAVQKDKAGGRSSPKQPKETAKETGAPRGQRMRNAPAPEDEKNKCTEKPQVPPRNIRPETALPDQNAASSSSDAPALSELAHGRAKPSSLKPPKQRNAASPSATKRQEGSAPPQEPNATALSKNGRDLSTPVFDAQPREELPDFILEGCDENMLFSTVRDVVGQLIRPVVGEAPCTCDIAGNRVRVAVDCGDASALLVGREGQTLASIQYLASRIIARRIGGSLRLQIDVDNYRERQDGKLKDLALSLAQKARTTGRTQSTRPLSAYQRRIIHLTLEGDNTVTTYSKGDGPQRRVVIQLQDSGPASGQRPARNGALPNTPSSRPEHVFPAEDTTELAGMPEDPEGQPPAAS